MFAKDFFYHQFSLFCKRMNVSQSALSMGFIDLLWAVAKTKKKCWHVYASENELVTPKDANKRNSIFLSFRKIHRNSIKQCWNEMPTFCVNMPHHDVYCDWNCIQWILLCWINFCHLSFKYSRYMTFGAYVFTFETATYFLRNQSEKLFFS